MQKFTEKVEQVLDRCRQANDENGDNKFWIVSDDAGRFLYKLATGSNAKTVLEIGTSIGYSTIFWAEAVKANGGVVYAMESHLKRAETAKRNFEDAGVSEIIRLVMAHAPEGIPMHDPITGKSLIGSVDILFLDCIKKLYLPCLKASLPLLKNGSLVVADNVTSHKDSMLDFLEFMQTNQSFETEILDIGTGLLVGKFTCL